MFRRLFSLIRHSLPTHARKKMKEIKKIKELDSSGTTNFIKIFNYITLRNKELIVMLYFIINNKIRVE